MTELVFLFRLREMLLAISARLDSFPSLVHVLLFFAPELSILSQCLRCWDFKTTLCAAPSVLPARPQIRMVPGPALRMIFEQACMQPGFGPVHKFECWHSWWHVVSVKIQRNKDPWSVAAQISFWNTLCAMSYFWNTSTCRIWGPDSESDSSLHTCNFAAIHFAPLPVEFPDASDSRADGLLALCCQGSCLSRMRGTYLVGCDLQLHKLCSDCALHLDFFVMQLEPIICGSHITYLRAGSLAPLHQDHGDRATRRLLFSMSQLFFLYCFKL